MPWIRSKIWADPVHVRLLYLYVRPIFRTFLRVFVCSSFVVCDLSEAACPGTFADVLLTMILAYEYCTRLGGCTGDLGSCANVRSTSDPKHF